MINAVSSTSGQEPAAGRRGSAGWSAPAAEDFQRTKGGSAAPGRKPRAAWRICVRLQGCVNKACGWGGLQPDSLAMSQIAYMTQNTRTAASLCLQNATNGGLSCPTCLIVTSFLSPTLQMGAGKFLDSDTTLTFIWAQNAVKVRPSWRNCSTGEWCWCNNQNTLSLKKYLFYSDREKKKKNVPPLNIWQACRHSHTWKALTGLCPQRAAPRTKQPFQQELV